MDTYKQLTEKISNYIPLTKQMNIEVEKIEPFSVTLRAPFELNKNHMDSVFGGSLYIVAVLSCWALTEEILQSKGLVPKYTMIKSSNMDYYKPVRGDFYACSRVEEEAVKNFILGLERKKLSRLNILSNVFYENKVCAELSGEFVSSL